MSPDPSTAVCVLEGTLPFHREDRSIKPWDQTHDLLLTARPARWRHAKSRFKCPRKMARRGETALKADCGYRMRSRPEEMRGMVQANVKIDIGDTGTQMGLA